LPLHVDHFTNSTTVAHPKLWFLGDALATPSWFPFANVFSIGDVLIIVGCAIIMHTACGSLLGRRLRLGPAVALERFEWVAAGPRLALVRLAGDWTPSAARGQPAALVVESGGAEHVLRAVPDPAAPPEGWRAAFAAPLDLFSADGARCTLRVAGRR